jgi:hypothetical protein
VTHPHHLHAQAALHSLRAARATLATHAADEALDIAAQNTEPATSYRSPTYGQRHSLGGHPSDPTAGAALNTTTPTPQRNRLAELATSVTNTLQWLADKLAAPSTRDPLDRLETALPSLRPSTTDQLRHWLDDEDERIRRVLGLPRDDYETAEQLATRLTTPQRPITPDRVYDWARRSRNPNDRLHGLLPTLRTPGERTGNTWYRVRDAIHVHELTARAAARVDDQAA